MNYTIKEFADKCGMDRQLLARRVNAAKVRPVNIIPARYEYDEDELYPLWYEKDNRGRPRDDETT